MENSKMSGSFDLISAFKITVTTVDCILRYIQSMVMILGEDP